MQIGRMKISPRLRIILIALVTVVFAITLSSGMASLNEQAAQIAQREEQLKTEKEAVDDLRRKIKFTQSDAYIEQAARNHLDLAYPNEVQFVDPRKTEQTP